MISSKDFKIRTCDATQQVGIKEEFNVIRDGDTDIITAVFGLDVEVNLTKPAVFTKNGFKPLLDAESSAEDKIKATHDFLQTKQGTYSVQEATMLICSFSGKQKDGVWLDGTSCDLFLPVSMDKKVITAVRVTAKTVYGCIEFPKLDEIEQKVITYLTSVCPSKVNFICRR